MPRSYISLSKGLTTTSKLSIAVVNTAKKHRGVGRTRARPGMTQVELTFLAENHLLISTVLKHR